MRTKRHGRITENDSLLHVALIRRAELEHIRNFEYVTRVILIVGDYAFIEAQAKTITAKLSTTLAQTTTTWNFFVLKRITGSWKIY